MTSYSQYDDTSSITASNISGRIWTVVSATSVRIKYSRGSERGFQFNKTGSDQHKWSDYGSNSPEQFSITGTSGPWSSTVPDAETIYTADASGNHLSTFLSPQWQYSSANSGSGSDTGTEGVPVFDINKDRFVVSGISQGTYWLNAFFGNGDVWMFTVPATQSYTVYPGGSEASPANTDSLVEFVPGTYYVTGTGSYVSPTFTVTVSSKKVFSNFW
jgi:hypothetical protein